MTCKEIRPLLYLYRDGELPERVRNDVARHCAQCAACAEEARRISASLEGARSSLREEPVLTGANDMLRAVLRDVAQAEERSSRSLLDLLTRRFGYVRLQAALGAAVIAVIALMFSLTIHDAFRLERLERSTAGAAQRATPAGDIRVFAAAVPVPPVSLNLAEDWNTLRRLWPLLKNSRTPDGTQFLDYIMNKYPALASVDPSDGIDEREQRILNTEGAALIGELQAFLHLERNNHEKE